MFSARPASTSPLVQLAENWAGGLESPTFKVNVASGSPVVQLKGSELPSAFRVTLVAKSAGPGALTPAGAAVSVQAEVVKLQIGPGAEPAQFTASIAQ